MHSSATSTAIRAAYSFAIEISRTGYSPFWRPPRGRVDHLAGGLDLRRHLGELVARDLEVADRAAEGGPLLGVLERAIEHVLRAGDRAGCADQSLALELPHDVVEALADLAERRRRGTRTSWKASSAVSEACIPSFASRFSRITPGRSIGTRNSVKPS